MMTTSEMASGAAKPLGARWPMRIFLVENHQDTRFLLSHLLRQLGHTVAEAATMHAALNGLRQGAFDILLSDVGLPDGTGWQLMAELGPQRPPYAIAMTGFGMPSDREQSLAAGYRQHLLKPMPPNQLESLLDEAGDELFGTPSTEQ